MTDWAVGDRALCIKNGEWTREGCAYTVSEILPPDEYRGGLRNVSGETLLFFADYHYPPSDPDGSCASRFRKIRPDEHEGNAEDWALLLETVKPKQLEPISTRDEERSNKAPSVNNHG